MHSVYTKTLEMVYSPRLGEREELAWISGAATGDGEVTMVHLIDDEVGRRLHHRALVVLPSLGIRFRHVEHQGIRAIHSDSLGEDAIRALAVHNELVGMEFEVFLHRGGPDAVLPQFHPHFLRLGNGIGIACCIILHIDLCICWCKEFEGCSLWCVCCLVEAEILSLSVNCCQSQ